MAGGHVRHQAGIVAGAAADFLQRVGIHQAVRCKKPGGCLTAKAGGAVGRHARGVEIGRADPQVAPMRGRAPALAQPVGQANMIRVHVRHDDPQNRQAFQLGRKNRLPLRFGFGPADAAIHRTPALDFFTRRVRAIHLVAQQPEVDVVQRKRQAHAQPFDARGDLKRAAAGRKRLTQGVMELLFKVIHVISGEM